MSSDKIREMQIKVGISQPELARQSGHAVSTSMGQTICFSGW